MSRPRSERIVPRSIGYAAGIARAQRARRRAARRGTCSAAAQRTVASAVSRARLSGSISAAQLGPRGRAVEAADAHVDRVDLAAAHDRHHRVARLLHLQALFDDLAVVARHLDRARVAEEVRRVQHVDVEAVALDPLAAVDEPAQVADRALVDVHAAGVLHRPHRAHLVGDRADPADPRGDVGRLREGAPAQQRLEEPRRLVDAQLDLLTVAAVELARTSRPRPRRGRGSRCG